MPNFALIRPVGGPRRTMDDYLQEADQRRSADMQRQGQEMQLQEGVQRQTDRRALRDIVQRSGGNWEQASQEAAAAGVSPDAVMALQDRARGDKKDKRDEVDYHRKEASDRFAVAGKLDEMLGQVTDQPSYDRYRAGAVEIAKEYNLPFDVPEAYDPKYVESKRASAQALHRVWKTLTPAEEKAQGLDESGTYQVNQSGEMKTIVKPRSEQKTVEQWGAMSPQEAEAAGFPAGSVIQRSTRGKYSAAYTPKGGGAGHDPAKVATAKWLMGAVPGMTEEEAYDRANMAGKNPLAFATDMVKLEVGSMNTGMEPAQLQSRIQYWMDNIPGKAPAVPKSDAPQGGLPPAAASQLKEGHVTTFGNGQQWTLQGGKQVRVK